MKNPNHNNTLYRGDGNNGLVTVLTPTGMAMLEEMYSRAAGGEEWRDIHATTSLHGHVATFARPESCTGRMAEYITGTTDELDTWLQAFTDAGGTYLPSTTGSNDVPFSNQRFDGEEGYVLTPAKICWMFGITPDMISLPHRRKVSVPA